MRHRPNLFIVGAPKSGTTAMNEYLRQHPEIFMASKEPHYFARDLLPAAHKSLTKEYYEALFLDVRDETVIGDASVFYLFSKVAADLIHEFDPKAKIIIHLRNPVDFIASHHSQVVYEGGEPIEDLEEALRVEPLRKQGLNLPEDFDWKYTLLYRDIASFSGQVMRYLDRFGRDSVHFVVFDDFQADTGAEYRKILEFLGVDPSFRVNFDVVNPNKRMRSKFLMDFAVRNPPRWASVASKLMFPLEARNAIKRAVKRLNTKYEPRRPVSVELRNSLKRDFLPEVERLSEILDRDLTGWCRS